MFIAFIFVVLAFPLGVASLIIANKKNRLGALWAYYGIMPFIGAATFIILLFLPKLDRHKFTLKQKTIKKSIKRNAAWALSNINGICLIIVVAFINILIIGGLLNDLTDGELAGPFTITGVLLWLAVAIIISIIGTPWSRGAKQFGIIKGTLLHTDEISSNKNEFICPCGRKEARWKKFDLKLRDKMVCPVCNQIICALHLELFYFPAQREILYRDEIEDIGALTKTIITTYRVTKPPSFICFHNYCFHAILMNLGLEDPRFKNKYKKRTEGIDDLIEEYIKKYPSIQVFSEPFIRSIMPFRYTGAAGSVAKGIKGRR